MTSAIALRREGEVTRVRCAPVLAVATAGLLGLLLVAASVGPLHVPIPEVAHILAGKLGFGDLSGISQRDLSVVWELRVPRALAGALIGAALALAGACMQSLFGNPLADPGIVGVTGGASTGAVAVIVLTGGSASALVSTWLVPLGAFLAGLAVTALIYVLARPGQVGSTSRMLLVGIAIGSGCAAITGFFTYVADDSQLQSLVFWQMGSLGKISWSQVAAMLPAALIGMALVGGNVRNLDALTLGERAARHLGVDVPRARIALVSATALLAGGAVSFAGSIGFVGLVVPHITRFIVGPMHRRLLPLSALIGALLIVAADCAARTLNPPSEIPIGLFTAALGAPFFLFLVVRTKRAG